MLLCVAPIPLLHILPVTVFVYQIVAAAFTPAKRSRIRTVWQVLVSWLTYNRAMRTYPAFFAAPQGLGFSVRQSPGSASFILSVACSCGPSAAMNALHTPRGILSSIAAAEFTPDAM